MSFLLIWPTTVLAANGEEESGTQDEKRVEHAVDITEEEFVQSLAEEKGISYEEAYAEHKARKNSNPYLMLRGPLYREVYQTRYIDYYPNGRTFSVRGYARLSLIQYVTTGEYVQITGASNCYVSVVGSTASNVSWNGSATTRLVNTKKLALDCLGNIEYNCSVSAGVAFPGNIISGSVGTTMYVRYFVDHVYYFLI